MTIKCTSKRWLYREWTVILPARSFVVAYNGRGLGYESVLVDGEVVVKTISPRWFIPRFEFTLGEVPALIEVRVAPWINIRRVRLSIDGVVRYEEGVWPVSDPSPAAE